MNWKLLLRSVGKTALLLVLFVVAASCDQGPVGIFASLEREEKIKKGNLAENATVSGMVRATSTDPDRYYAALGHVWVRSAGPEQDAEWNDIGTPSGYGSGGVSTGMVSVGGTIYVGFVSADATKSAIYTLDPADNSFSDDPVYQQTERQVTDLFAVDTDGDGTADELFAAVKDHSVENDLGYAYDLVASPQASGGTLVVNDEERIIDGAYFVALSEYVFISQSRIFSGGSISTDSLEPGQSPGNYNPDLPESADLAGLLYDTSTDHAYLSTRGGVIHYSGDGGVSWSATGANEEHVYTDMAVFTQLDGTAGGVVVGLENVEDSDGGYVELPGGGIDNVAMPSGNNYLAAEISNTTVSAFFVDETADPRLLFALTPGKGLWRARYADAEGNPQSDPFWSWE